MTSSHRKFYFYFLVAIFLIASPAVIIYSQGYSLDLKTFSLVKTGGIFVATTPKGVLVYINGKLTTTTSALPLTQGKLISRLLPDDYAVKIEKGAYLGWDKKLKVEPQLVTEVRNVFLIPTERTVETIETGVSDVIVSDSNASIAYIKENGIAVLDVASPKIIPLAAQEDERIGKVRFGADEGYLVVESLQKNQSRKYLFRIGSQERMEIMEDDIERYVKIRQYSKGEPRIIALSTTNTLYTVDLRVPHEKVVVATNIVNFEMFGNKAVYATTAPTILYEKDLISGKTNQIIETPLEYFDANSRIIRSTAGHIAIIGSDNTLYLYDGDQLEFKRIADNVIGAVFSDDNKKLAWHNKNELYVYYLKDVLIQPKKKVGDIELITRLSRPITGITWFSYDNEHIFFIAEKKIRFIELDGRDHRNVYDIAEAAQALKISYNGYDDYLYFLDGTLLKKISLFKL
ncbi:MAG: hypothetical protein NUV61_03855 [Candidatus Azambacteria bacterium]|nr:hypothetical protein [Candidatus Azambacteria bacterium]